MVTAVLNGPAGRGAGAVPHRRRANVCPGCNNSFVLLFVAVLLVIPPASSGAPQQSYVTKFPADSRIVLMPPDIRYYLISAGGNPELHEAWTADAESRFSIAFAAGAASRGVNAGVASRADLSEQALSYEGLHAAVGEAIVEHVVGDAGLPSKSTNRINEWTLGPGVSVIREETGADYALFVHYRDNQSSGGRIAFAILAAAANRVIPTGSEHGFASLVDLQHGTVAWFAVLPDAGLELREEDGAAELAAWILGQLPVAGALPRDGE